MSYEPSRSKAYDSNIHWRIVYQRFALEYSVQRVSENLGVSPSTVRQIGSLFDSTGSVDQKVDPDKGVALKTLSSYDEFYIMELVLERPGIYLREICFELYQLTGAVVSEATVCRFLKKVGFTRTKIQHVAIQQSKEFRARFIAEVQLYRADMFVFIDESGTDRRDSLRKFGYSMRGKRTRSHKLLARGKHISVIAAMSTQGMLDYRLAQGGVDAIAFREFVEKCLLRHVMPFDRINPHSIIIMDNASIHHTGDSIELIESMGVLVLFVPPYSPDLNAIEEAFSSIKSYLKANEEVLQESNDIEKVVAEAFASVPPENCQAWIKDSGCTF